jgi:hypothetical protein
MQLQGKLGMSTSNIKVSIYSSWWSQGTVYAVDHPFCSSGAAD